MPFCAQCGTKFEGNFCPACGTKVAGAQAGPPPNSGNPFDAPEGGPSSDSVPLDEHVASALCYVPMWALGGVLFLVLEPYSSNRTIRFHGYQSVFSFVAFFIGLTFLQILQGLPFLGLIFLFLSTIYVLIWLGLLAFMAYKAYNKERFLLPIIGPLAERQV